MQQATVDPVRGHESGDQPRVVTYRFTEPVGASGRRGGVVRGSGPVTARIRVGSVPAGHNVSPGPQLASRSATSTPSASASRRPRTASTVCEMNRSRLDT